MFRTQGQPLGQTVSSFSSCLLIPLISTLPRLFGECLKGSGYSLRIMSRLTICSTLSIEAWRGWANLTLSTSPKKPYMFIYFSELLRDTQLTVSYTHLTLPTTSRV